MFGPADMAERNEVGADPGITLRQEIRKIAARADQLGRPAAAVEQSHGLVEAAHLGGVRGVRVAVVEQHNVARAQTEAGAQPLVARPGKEAALVGRGPDERAGMAGWHMLLQALHDHRHAGGAAQELRGAARVGEYCGNQRIELGVRQRCQFGEGAADAGLEDLLFVVLQVHEDRASVRGRHRAAEPAHVLARGPRMHDARAKAIPVIGGQMVELVEIQRHERCARQGAEGLLVVRDGDDAVVAQADQFVGEAGDGNGSLAAKGLECGAVNDLFAVLLLEFHPQAQHLAAIRVADRADGVGPGQFAKVLRIGQRRLNPLLQIVIHFSIKKRTASDFKVYHEPGSFTRQQ